MKGLTTELEKAMSLKAALSPGVVLSVVTLEMMPRMRLGNHRRMNAT